jgi:hypothetical protein
LAEDIEAASQGRFADNGEESRWLVAANQEIR